MQQSAAARECAVEPKLVGDHIRMEVGFETDVAAMTVPMIGVLSAVAIPAFMKNARKAKTAEATHQLNLIANGVDAARKGNRLPKGEVGPTPAAGSCCRAEGDKCRDDPGIWKHRLWKQLGYSVDDPHYYSYRYQSDGKTFVAVAEGDLDCDGQLSRFTLSGTVGGDGNLIRDLRVENELE